MSNLGEFLGEAKEFDLGEGKILVLARPKLREVGQAERWEKDHQNSTTIECMAQLILVCAKKVNPTITIDDIMDNVPAGKVLDDITDYIMGKDNKADNK